MKIRKLAEALKDIDFQDVDSNFIRRKLSVGEQYILVSGTAQQHESILIGTLTTTTTIWDDCRVGLISVGSPDIAVPRVHSSITAFKFFKVTYNSLRYIAVKKPENSFSEETTITYIRKPALANQIFQVVNANALTDIVAL